MADYKPESMVKAIRQSPPIDVTTSYDAAWVKDKVILITGGASGFGAGFVRLWAQHGATVIVGDINVKMGDALVRDVRKQTGGQRGVDPLRVGFLLRRMGLADTYLTSDATQLPGEILPLADAQVVQELIATHPPKRVA